MFRVGYPGVSARCMYSYTGAGSEIEGGHGMLATPHRRRNGAVFTTVRDIMCVVHRCLSQIILGRKLTGSKNAAKISRRTGISPLDLLCSDIYLVIDEGQTTYQDTSFWNCCLKSAIGMRSVGIKIVLLCSYGSPAASREIFGIAPFQFPEHHHVSLVPTTKVVVGLFLTEDEHFHYVDSFWNIRLSQELVNTVYEWTRGHIGASFSLMQFFASSQACISLYLPTDWMLTYCP